MKKMLSVLLITFFALAILFNSSTTQQTNAVENQVLAQVDTLDEAEALEAFYGITLINYTKHGLATYVTSNTQYETLLDTDIFHPNTLYQSEELTTQRNPFASPQDDQYALDIMQFRDAWAIELGQENIVVAVIDTGVNHTLDIFDGKILETSYNPVTETYGLDAVMDDEGHGTAVSSIIAASHTNTNFLGAAPGVQILKIKANTGEENRSFEAGYLIAGIQYAMEQGVDVINLSLGGGSYNTLLESALQDAYDAGIVIIAAAGNDGEETMFYPAGYDSVITVSSIDSSKTLSEFSNYGDHVDLTAPGESILVVDIDGNLQYSSGTSLSAPYVSSVFALLKSQYPNLSTQELIDRVFDSAEDLGNSNFYGHGIANAYNAINVDYIDVTIMVDDELVNIVTMSKGAEFTLPLYVKDNHDFYWYATNDYINKLTEDTIYPTENITLYGRHEIYTYTVNFFDHDLTTIIKTETIEHGSDATPPSDPIKPDDDNTSFAFIGWDKAYTNITGSLNIYPVYEEVLYDYEVELINSETQESIETLTVEHGTLISSLSHQRVLIDGNTLYLLDESLLSEDSVTSNDSIEIIYNSYDLKTFFTLNPSVDTVKQGHDYTDQGLDILLQSEMFNVVASSINTNTLGTHLVTYTIYHEEEIIHTVDRYVEVIQAHQPITITLNKGIDTLFVGDTYQDPGVRINHGTLTTTSNVDTTQAGVYTITYQVTTDNETLIKVRYVTVLQPPSSLNLTPTYLEKKEGWYYA